MWDQTSLKFRWIKWIKWILIGIGIMVILSSVIFLVWTKKDKEKNRWVHGDVLFTESIVTPTIKPKVDTSDWQTYSNSVAGFQFKYPKQFWEISPAVKEDVNTTLTPFLYHLCKYQVHCGAVGFDARQNAYTPGWSVEQYFRILDLNEVISSKKVKIGGEDAYNVKFNRKLQNGQISIPETVIYILHKEKIFQINIGAEQGAYIQYEREANDILKYDDVAEAILTTFRFLN